MKPTFRQILDSHPTALYTLEFKNVTLYDIPAKTADAEIRKEWFKYCPTYEVETLFDDGTLKLEHITAKFYKEAE